MKKTDLVKVKIGDLVISKNRYRNRYFIVVDKCFDHQRQRNLIKCYNREYQTRWCMTGTWEVVSESR